MKIKAYKAVLNEKGQPYMKEAGTEYKVDGRKTFSNPEGIADFAAFEIGLNEAAEEYVYILCLDTKCKITGLFQASHGSVNCSFFPIREIFQKSLLLGAVSIVIIHNHPTGIATPSQSDIDSTKRAREAGEILGVSVVDHIIIGHGRTYYSFAEYGI